MFFKHRTRARESLSFTVPVNAELPKVATVKQQGAARWACFTQTGAARRLGQLAMSRTSAPQRQEGVGVASGRQPASTPRGGKKPRPGIAAR